MRDAFISELVQLAHEDPSIFLVVGDLGYNVVEGFAEAFPDRFLNAGVAEQTMIGVAAGLAAAGFRVFVYSIGNFPTMRCLEQIRNDICYHGLPVTVVAVGAGFSYGTLGYTHHAIEDIAVMRAMPNMTVLSPADPFETKVLVRQAATTPGPHYLRLGTSGEPSLYEQPPVDGALGALREGSDVTLVTTGSIGAIAITAREQLAKAGVSARIVSVPVIKPLDPSVLASAAGTAGIVSIEEHSRVGGLGSALLEQASRDRDPVRIISIGVPEETLGKLVGSRAYLREHNGLTPEAIVDAALELVGMTQAS